MVVVYGPRNSIHRPFSRTFCLLSKNCKLECNTTFDWLNRMVKQSEVMLHPNAVCVCVCVGERERERERERDEERS